MTAPAVISLFIFVSIVSAKSFYFVDIYFAFTHGNQFFKVISNSSPRVSRTANIVSILGLPLPRSMATNVFMPMPAKAASIGCVMLSDLRLSRIVLPICW